MSAASFGIFVDFVDRVRRQTMSLYHLKSATVEAVWFFGDPLLSNQHILHVPDREIPFNSLEISFDAPIFSRDRDFISMFHGSLFDHKLRVNYILLF